MRKRFIFMVGCMFAAQVFTVGTAIGETISLGKGEAFCGPPKGVGCGGCLSNGPKGCYVVYCGKSSCTREWFRPAPGRHGVLFRGNVSGALR